MSKYHTRSGYEKLFYQLSLACGIPFQMSVSAVSDSDLLNAIDQRLFWLDCEILTDEELCMELSK